MLMRFVRCCFCSFLFLCLYFTMGQAFAVAYYPSGLFLEGGANAGRVLVSDIVLNNDGIGGSLSSNMKNLSNSGLGFMAGAGFKLKYLPIGISVDYTYRPKLSDEMEQAIQGGGGTNNENIASNFQNSTFLANVFVDLTIWNEDYFVPFLTGGVGFSKNETSLTATAALQPSSRRTVHKSTRSLAWQVGAGFHVRLSNNFYVNVMYRHVELGKVKWGPWTKLGSQTYNARKLTTDTASADEAVVALVVYLGNQQKPKGPPTLINDA